MDIHRSGVPHIFIAPDAVKQLLSCEYPIGMLCQKAEQLKFLRGKIQTFPMIQDGIIRQIDFQFPEFQNIFILLLLWLISAQHRLHARHQLLWFKGLYDIIICAQLQPKHLIKGFALRRQHDNRHTACLSHLCADLIAVHSGEHQIQQD